MTYFKADDDESLECPMPDDWFVDEEKKQNYLDNVPMTLYFSHQTSSPKILDSLEVDYDFELEKRVLRLT